jgi:hypothetical protein
MKDPFQKKRTVPVRELHTDIQTEFCFILAIYVLCIAGIAQKKKVGDSDFIPDKESIQIGLDYIKSTPVFEMFCFPVATL